jgi:uncharacterized membrane protein
MEYAMSENEENVYDLYEMIGDFAILIYTKKYVIDKHESNIREEALDRVHKYGCELVTAEVKRRKYAELQERVVAFEIANPEVKNPK